MIPAFPRKRKGPNCAQDDTNNNIGRVSTYTQDMGPAHSSGRHQHKKNRTSHWFNFGEKRNVTNEADNEEQNTSGRSSSHRMQTNSRITNRSCSSRQSHNQGDLQTATPEHRDSSAVTEQKLLQKYKAEVECLTVHDSRTGVSETRYYPTYRAQLASRGYLIKEKLGKGSYSQVRLAKYMNRNPPVEVAVKIVDRHEAPRDFKNKFLPREIQIWPMIQHPNIVRILRQFQDNRRVYFVMEYCQDGDALHYIQTRGALSENRANYWFVQLCGAVRYLHARHITHRDIKLENILLHGNSVKLCDFGFAKTCDGKLSDTYCGSKSYASPEILSGSSYDPKKADVWALGVVLFIFISGKMPFDEKKGNTGIIQDQRRLNLYWPSHISTECRHLITSTLTYPFGDRPGITELFQHRWLRSPKRKS